jgi:hypothetical protein
MARIQILELPTEHHGDDMITPFAVVIDQLPVDAEGRISDDYNGLADKLGARAVLAFEDTVEIPANEVPVDPDGYPLKFRVEGDFEQFRAQVQEEIGKAQAAMILALNRP